MDKYKEYTEIQKLAMPIVASGENCILIAPTGSGKTEAAVLPLIDRISDDGPGVKLLYVTPLRALNRDMIKRLEKMCKDVGVSIAVRHGDTKQSERNKQAKLAPKFLITTPETLQSILPTKTVGAALRNLRAVVIDEVHELYYNKRGAQLSIALERLEEIAPNFQRVGISATVGNVDVIKNFLCGERSCKIAKADIGKSIQIRVELPQSAENKSDHMIEKFGLNEESLARLYSIAGHISSSRSTIIFANTRQVVEALGSRLVYLNRINNFGGIGVHHSSLDKNERIAIENAFKNNTIKSIIATSSLELGIDIGEVDLVIQYGSPRQALRLTQRVGRSGHTQRGISKGVIISTNKFETIESLAIYLKLLDNSFETFKPQMNPLDVLANQICGIALDKGMIHVDNLYRIIRRSFLYKNMKLEKLKLLLEFMNRQRMIGFDGAIVTGGGRTRMYYYDHLSVIPDVKRFLVKNIVENRIISTLDERFVANNIDENSIFITKGLPWKVIDIDKDIIMVEPSMELEAAVPDWTGEDIPVSYDVVQRVFSLLENLHILKNKDYISNETYAEIYNFVEEQKKYRVPKKSVVLVEQMENYKILYTGLGTQANEALSRLLAYTLSLKVGSSVSVKSSPYFIFLELGKSLDVAKALGSIDASVLEKEIEKSIVDTELFRYKFVTVAKIFGIIDKGAVTSRSLVRRIIKIMTGTPVYEETVRELSENYFDIETIRSFLNGIKSGSLEIVQINLDSLSPLTKVILNSAYYTKELIAPLTPNSEIVASFAKFILAKEMKLLCTYCGFNFTRRLERIKDLEKIRCENCKSTLICPYDEKYTQIIRKGKAERRLGADEKSALGEMIRYSSLFDSYGGRAAIALSVYGIGLRTAARALMMRKHDERSFFIDLIEAQKTFIRTKKYWSI